MVLLQDQFHTASGISPKLHAATLFFGFAPRSAASELDFASWSCVLLKALSLASPAFLKQLRSPFPC